MVEDKSNVRMRMAVPDDAPAIASVLYQAFVEHKPAYTDGGFAATTSTSDQIRSRMSEGPVWVVLQDEAIVGTVSVVPRGDVLYIRGMAVLPTARGQGIGEMLLKHVEGYAYEQGHRRLYLSTTPFLLRAISLYEHFGFARSSEGPYDLFGTPLFTMVKTLKPADE
jgi:GNAT superfamily N-acetyltransferase